MIHRLLAIFVCFSALAANTFIGRINPVIVEIPTAGLVGWWQFNEGVGNLVADSSGNGNQGTLQGAATWATPRKTGSGAVDFLSANANSGSATNYVDCGYSSTLAVTTGTLLAWINPASVGTYQVIAGKEDWNSDLYGYVMVLNFTQGQLFTELADGVGPQRTTPAVAASVSTFAWTHVAMRWDGSKLNAFINGIKDTSNTTQTKVPTYTVNWRFLIGRGDNYLSQGFGGKMSDVRMYNRALTDTEIQNIYTLTQ